MADPNGFLTYPRNDNPYRELAERIKDFAELQSQCIQRAACFCRSSVDKGTCSSAKSFIRSANSR